MGEEAPAEMKEEGDSDSDDVSSDEEMTNDKKTNQEDVDSEEELDELENTHGKSGNDALNSNAYDIPIANDIPIIAKLAKQIEKEKLDRMDG